MAQGLSYLLLSAEGHGEYLVTHTTALPQCMSVSCPGLCVGGIALPWLQLALEPVHQHYPAEYLLPSPADRLNFSFKPKDNTEATFSCLLFLHKCFVSQYLEEYFSLSCVIWQITQDVYIPKGAE